MRRHESLRRTMPQLQRDTAEGAGNDAIQVHGMTACVTEQHSTPYASAHHAPPVPLCLPGRLAVPANAAASPLPPHRSQCARRQTPAAHLPASAPVQGARQHAPQQRWSTHRNAHTVGPYSAPMSACRAWALLQGEHCSANGMLVPCWLDTSAACSGNRPASPGLLARLRRGPGNPSCPP